MDRPIRLSFRQARRRQANGFRIWINDPENVKPEVARSPSFNPSRGINQTPVCSLLVLSLRTSFRTISRESVCGVVSTSKGAKGAKGGWEGWRVLLRRVPAGTPGTRRIVLLASLELPPSRPLASAFLRLDLSEMDRRTFRASLSSFASPTRATRFPRGGNASAHPGIWIEIEIERDPEDRRVTLA
jgi:hypothetical protein